MVSLGRGIWTKQVQLPRSAAGLDLHNGIVSNRPLKARLG